MLFKIIPKIHSTELQIGSHKQLIENDTSSEGARAFSYIWFSFYRHTAFYSQRPIAGPSSKPRIIAREFSDHPPIALFAKMRMTAEGQVHGAYIYIYARLWRASRIDHSPFWTEMQAVRLDLSWFYGLWIWADQKMWFMISNPYYICHNVGLTGK